MYEYNGACFFLKLSFLITVYNFVKKRETIKKRNLSENVHVQNHGSTLQQGAYTARQSQLEDMDCHLLFRQFSISFMLFFF